MSFLSSVGGFFKGLFSFVKREAGQAVAWINSPEGQAFGQKLASIVQAELPLITDLAKANFVAAEVVSVFTKYGVPVINELAAGTLAADVKKFIQDTLLTYLTKKFNVTATEATIAYNAAYLSVKA